MIEHVVASFNSFIRFATTEAPCSLEEAQGLRNALEDLREQNRNR